MLNPYDGTPETTTTVSTVSLRLRASGLPPGRSRKFRLLCGAEEIEGFVVNYRGSYYAYVNRCRHIPLSLDWMENQFFTPDGEYVMCQTHGAIYDPETGQCLAGPPVGETLCRLSVRVDGEDLIIECPSDGGPLPREG